MYRDPGRIKMNKLKLWLPWNWDWFETNPKRKKTNRI